MSLLHPMNNTHCANVTLRVPVSGKDRLVIKVHGSMLNYAGLSEELAKFIAKDNDCVQSGITISIAEGMLASPSCYCTPAISISSTFVSEDNDDSQWREAFAHITRYLLKIFETEDEAIITIDTIGYLVSI